MIKFLDLQAVNARYRDEMLAAMTRVLVICPRFDGHLST